MSFFSMIRRPPRSTLFPYTTSSDLGGTLKGGQTLYYAFAAVDSDGNESGLSFVVRATVVIDDSKVTRSEEHTPELQSRFDLVCRLLLEKKKVRNMKARRLHIR